MEDIVYRCVTKDGISGDILCIGLDQSQGGSDYNGVGIWCNFTFTNIPEPNEELCDFIQKSDKIPTLLKVVDENVVLKDISEI